jgi:phosphoribosylformimino-5-aminoimidazole carboxamide ribotide isomerase
MIIFPAIDIYDGKVVRLAKGDFDQMTVYDSNPLARAEAFKAAGAKYLHAVDLNGAREGSERNLDTIKALTSSGLLVQVGGGIRTLATAEKYLSQGVWRVVLGTAAAENPAFAAEAVKAFGAGHVAVGVDIKDGRVAIKGWTELSSKTCPDFCAELCEAGVQTIICTDVSRDGLLAGSNIKLYRDIQARFPLNITASGGVTTIDELKTLAAEGFYGAILGRALYENKIELSAAIAAIKEVSPC